MNTPVAVVTGANKGLGLAMIAALCRRMGPHAHVYLTARDQKRGQAAVAALRAEGLSPLFAHLDLSDPESITTLAGQLGTRHGGVDLLIQNGAYAALPDVPGKDQVRTMVTTNNLGTHHVLRAFGPLLRPQARVLVVASGFGTLKSLAPQLHSLFDTERQSLADLEKTLEDYVRAVEGGREEAAGWPSWINIPSKIAQLAATRIFARELSQNPASSPGILANAVCPGWMITDASRPYLKDLPAHVTPKLPEEAVDDALWPAFLPSNSPGPNGELIQYRQILPWR